MASSRVEWDYSYQKLLQEGTIPIWKEVNHRRQIYRFGHNHYLRQVIDRVHSRYYRGFCRGSLWATDIGIVDHAISLLRDEGMLTGKHNKDYVEGAKKLFRHVFKGHNQPNSLEYTDFMDNVNSMSKIEDLIPLYFHPLNFTEGERFMFPVAALVRLNFRKTVDVAGKDVPWTVAYENYCALNSYEYVRLGPNRPPQKQIRKVNIGKIASHSDRLRGLYYGFDVYAGTNPPPQYRNTYLEELFFVRNTIVHYMEKRLQGVAVDEDEIVKILGEYFPNTILDLHNFMKFHKVNLDVIGIRMKDTDLFSVEPAQS